MSAPWEQTAEEVRAAVNGHRDEPIEFEVVQGSLRDIRRTRWAWKGWAPLGAFVIVAGEGSAGKGVVSCYLLAQWTRGQAPGDLEHQPVSVLWIGHEDSWPEQVLPRLVAAGADPDRLFNLRAPAGAVLELARDQEALGRLVSENEIKVIAFEALVDHLGAATDDHRNADVRRALAPVVELARAKQLLVLGTTHLNKTTTGGFRHRVAGSGGYLAVARAGWLVHRHPDNPEAKVLAFGKGNLGEWPDSIVFEIEGQEVENPTNDEVADVGHLVNPYVDASLSVDEVLAGPKPDHGSLEDEVVDFLEEFLAGGPMRSTDVYEEGEKRGLNKRALQRHKEAAKVHAVKKADGWWWEPR